MCCTRVPRIRQSASGTWRCVRELRSIRVIRAMSTAFTALGEVLSSYAVVVTMALWRYCLSPQIYILVEKDSPGYIIFIKMFHQISVWAFDDDDVNKIPHSIMRSVSKTGNAQHTLHYYVQIIMYYSYNFLSLIRWMLIDIQEETTPKYLQTLSIEYRSPVGE